MAAGSCPVCGAAHATCGGPSTSRPVDLPYNEPEGAMTDNDMVIVHVDEGKRGYDMKFTRREAKRFTAANQNARIVNDTEADDEPKAEGDDEPKAEAEAKAEGKAQARAEDKAQAAPKR
jgi:hypothetical protein